MPDVGEQVTLTLTVTPYDGTTTATITATSPTGTVSTVTPTTVDGGATWTGYLSLTEAGAWRILWTVTGQGAGVETDTVYAFALDPTIDAYATLSDLASYLRAVPPDDAATLLEQASRLVDVLLIGAVYDVDEDGMPTDADDIAALRKATCAQVKWFDETGDSTGAAEQFQSASIGAISFTRGYTGAGSLTGAGQRYAPDAINTLRLAGLLPATAWAVG